MGMSIDTAIYRLRNLHFEQDDWENGELTEDCSLNREALRLAVKTMHKYQKIEQIYQKWDEVNNFSYNQAMQKIGEVLEDGND